MKEGRDYGKVGKMTKPALHQPGAELLLAEFGLSSKSIRVDATEDIEGDFFSYAYLCEIWDGDVFIASREGVCNSDEANYRNQAPRRLYREIRAGGGVPEKPTKNDPSVYGAGEGAETYAAMAQKRAMVAATLVATDTHFLFPLDDDMESVRASMGNGKSGRPCPAHPGKDFFKKGNMRGYAHPMDDGPWCDEEKIIDEYAGHAKAAIAQLMPLDRGQNQAHWAAWIKSTFPNMPDRDDRTAQDWANIAKRADDDFQTTGPISVDISESPADDAPPEGVIRVPENEDDFSWDDVDVDDPDAVSDALDEQQLNEGNYAQ